MLKSPVSLPRKPTDWNVMQKTLIVITGPTASGKTKVAIEVAKRLQCEIISADSRQMFADIPIATAAPTQEERAAVAHHFVGTLSLDDYYSAACFEEDVIGLLNSDLFKKSDYAVMCGGSMMYVDAVTRGIDEMPTISSEVRQNVMSLYETEGAEGLLARLRLADPEYYNVVDLKNTKRVAHALEIIYESGMTYTSFRTGRKKQRKFRIIKFAVDIPRDKLYESIMMRVGRMVENGLIDEIRRVSEYRSLNSLNTVGVKEIFAYLDGIYTLDEAIEKIARNTRVYAKKQLTWLKKDQEVIRCKNASEILEYVLG